MVKGKEALKTDLRRMYQAEAEFVIGDPTGNEGPPAKKTAYVGQLSDSQTPATGLYSGKFTIIAMTDKLIELGADEILRILTQS